MIDSKTLVSTTLEYGGPTDIRVATDGQYVYAFYETHRPTSPSTGETYLWGAKYTLDDNFDRVAYTATPITSSTPSQNNNHRGYPTVQLYKTAGGAYQTPVLIELWVWLDVDLSPGEWFSFATLDHTTSDTWGPVLVNLSDQGFVHLMHVPHNGQGEHIFQTSTLEFPMRQWVKLTIVLHFNSDHGYAEVWQDEQLVSTAEVKRGNGFLTQAHFGLYAPPSLSSGAVYNDDLTIWEGTSFFSSSVENWQIYE